DVAAAASSNSDRAAKKVRLAVRVRITGPEKLIIANGLIGRCAAPSSKPLIKVTKRIITWVSASASPSTNAAVASQTGSGITRRQIVRDAPNARACQATIAAALAISQIPVTNSL